MTNMTALEWLIDQMFKQGYFDGNKPLSITNLDHLQHQAMEMEKQQIIDAFDCDGNPQPGEKWISNGEQYYNETYGSLGSSLKWNGEVAQGSKGSDKEEQKKLITEIMNEDAKDGLYNTSSQTEISAVKYLSDAILSQKYNNDIFDLHNIIQNAFLIEKELINKQAEISDEEILAEAKTIFNDPRYLYAFHVGATWYREQLKKKQ